jgi:predicted RNase H-like HicB family nuclease
MEKMINIKVEHIQENSEEFFLATSEDIQGLIAQGSTVEETLEIAQSLVYDLLEVRKEIL